MIQPAAAAATLRSSLTVLASCVTGRGSHGACAGSSLGAVMFAGLAVVIVYVALLVLSIVAWVKIVTKAGYSGWWVLVAFVPVVNFVMMLVFAFSRWPALIEADRLRAQSAGPPGFGPAAGWGGGWGPGGTGFGGSPYGSAPFGPGAAGTAVAGGPQMGGPGGPGTGASGAGGMPGGSEAQPGRSPVEVEAALPSFWNFQPHGPADPPAAGGPTVAAGPAGPGQPGAAGQPVSSADVGRPAAQVPATSPPAGWYPTPEGRQRYWDGTRWTDHFA